MNRSLHPTWEELYLNRLEWLEVGEIGPPNSEHRKHYPLDHLPEPNVISLHNIQDPSTFLDLPGASYDWLQMLTVCCFSH